MSTLPQPRLTLREYLELEEKAEYKSEFFDGEMFAMAGGTPEHGLLAASLTALRVSQVRPRGCRVYSSDVRIAIQATGLYTYPDLSIICGPAEHLPEDPNSLTNPILIAEVLSPSTEAYDRGRKLEHYMTIPSLRHYLLVATNSLSVHVYTREDRQWLLTTNTRAEDVVRLPAVGAEFRVADLYADVIPSS